MYWVFFYFENKELKNILNYIHILNKIFSKNFWLKYDWLAFDNVEKFLKLNNKEFNMILWVPKINDYWPYNEVAFLENEFTISVQISKDIENIEEFEKKLKDYIKEIFLELPIILVYATIDWDWSEFSFSEFLDKDLCKQFAFVWKIENWKINFYDWEFNILWVKRK